MPPNSSRVTRQLCSNSTSLNSSATEAQPRNVPNAQAGEPKISPMSPKVLLELAILSQFPSLKSHAVGSDSHCKSNVLAARGAYCRTGLAFLHQAITT